MDYIGIPAHMDTAIPHGTFLEVAVVPQLVKEKYVFAHVRSSL